MPVHRLWSFGLHGICVRLPRKSTFLPACIPTRVWNVIRSIRPLFILIKSRSLSVQAARAICFLVHSASFVLRSLGFVCHDSYITHYVSSNPRNKMPSIIYNTHGYAACGRGLASSGAEKRWCNARAATAVWSANPKR